MCLLLGIPGGLDAEVALNHGLVGGCQRQGHKEPSYRLGPPGVAGSGVQRQSERSGQRFEKYPLSCLCDYSWTNNSKWAKWILLSN